MTALMRVVNDIDNLRWDSQRGNLADAIRQGKFIHRHTEEWKAERKRTSSEWIASEVGQLHVAKLKDMYKGKKVNTVRRAFP